VSPAGAPGWLVDQLPVGMLTDDFLVRFTSIFEDVGATLVDAVDSIDSSVDLSIAPEEFVRWLGSWINASPHPGGAAQVPGDHRERAWIQAQARALSGRGTQPGLQLMLQELCGQPVQVTDGGGVYPEGQYPPGDSAWVRIDMPTVPEVSPSSLLDLIRAEVPVHVAVYLIIDGILVNGTDTPLYSPFDGELDSEPEEPGELGQPRLLRRLPGTAGRAGQPFRACPTCAERHPISETSCWRCGLPLLRALPVPEPEPEPLVPDPAPELVLPRIWPVAVLIALAILLMAALLTGAALIW
jgi:phage tail-like protein